MKLPPFQLLLDAHREDIYRFLVASVGRNEAEDCFQETFLAALTGYPDLRDAANLKGWLFTISHHKAIDYHRRRRPEPIRRALSVMVGGTEPSPTDERLWNLVRGLPPKQRSAIALRFIEDLSYRMIGTVIGCSEGAARQNVRAGLARLREDLNR